MTPEQRILEILKRTAVEIRPCKFCKATLYMIPTRGRKPVVPYTEAGIDHFTDCPQYNKPKPPSQEGLFSGSAPHSGAFDPVR